MYMMTMVLTMASIKNMNPISISISVLLISLMTTMMIFKTSMTSWASFVIIITFSSGMMTLFMYTASMTSNEINKMKKNKTLLMLMMITLVLPHSTQSVTQMSMKMFSNQTILTTTALILITTMLAISTHGHHPHQTLTTSF